MKLIERYSLSTGLKIDNPYIYYTYYPIPTDKYVVFHFSSKDNLRDYKYWGIVIEQLKKYLSEYKFIQIGIKEDPTFPGIDIDLRGKTNLKQSAYVIKNCDLFVGVDSFPIHLAGFFRKKCVGIYSNSYKSCTEPVWMDRSIARLIETYRLKDEKPSFSFHEEPKTIDRINPEEIVENALSLLDITQDEKIETIFIGDKFNIPVFDIIPDAILPKQFNPDIIPYIRNDLVLFGNDQILYSQLFERKCNVVTKSKLDVSMLKKLRQNLNQLVIEINDTSLVDFVKQVHFSGINYILISYLDNEQINKIKLEYSDYAVINKMSKTKKESYFKNDIYRNIDWSKLDNFENCFFKTNKFLFSSGKIYLGESYYRAGIPLANQQQYYKVELDNDLFWQDGDFFYFFRKTKKNS